MQDFRKLRAWKSAHDLTLRIYRATRAFPSDERFGLTAQLRRGSASIAANIAEGCGRRSPAELARFLVTALGSAYEVEYHLLLAKDLSYLSAELHRGLQRDVVDIKRMLVGLIKAVNR